ncbi:hypothetical protein [Ornithinimicrobium flavum]|uniref:hypothetical protein n=1 Tax=Ornithinimicrobium flavum TaxID=1288636 RepID=UPI00106F54AF|nr:hypothetical protein [Ornithinimicrobium flavum]
MPSDHEAELAAAAREAQERLARRLPLLVSRRVPVRGLTRGPVTGTARLRLADSTTVLVEAVVPGQLGRVLLALERHRSVTLREWRRTPEGLEVVLAGVPGREAPRLRVLGPDQPD